MKPSELFTGVTLFIVLAAALATLPVETVAQDIKTDDSTYNIYFRVTDRAGFDDPDYATVVIAENGHPEEDDTPPQVSITKPVNALYIRNRTILPFIIPIVIGNIDIEVDASDNESGIERVKFYIDGELKAMDNSTPYTHRWDERVFRNFKHTIEVPGL